MLRKRVVSGIQPTGILHLGNYLGAIKKWQDFQASKEYDCFFFIADHHSNTLRLMEQIESIHETGSIGKQGYELDDYCLKSASCLLGIGIDPKKVCLFVQSQIPQHTELMWILSCVTPMSWLNNMIQFKEKKNKSDQLNSAGLFTYPILMSADILLYNAEEVPVGEDQLQHIQLTRDLAERVNKLTNKKLLNVPNYSVHFHSRIMSLQNGRKKMSKSDKTKNSSISLVDNFETMKEKIIKAKTDANTSITYDPENRPEVANLLSIYSVFENTTPEESAKKFEKANFFEFKTALVNTLEKNFLPICERTNKILRHETEYVMDVLNEGKKRALVEANETLEKVKSELKYL